MSSCPSCLAVGAVAFFSQSHACVTTTAVFDSKVAAQAAPQGRIELARCTACGLIFNTCFDEMLATTGDNFQTSQAASNQFVEFSMNLAAQWVEQHQLVQRTVIEVGCGQGEFLTQLLQAGARDGIGMDPRLAGTNCLAPSTNITWMPSRFDQSCSDMPGDVLICRHTLEHVGDVHGLIHAMAMWARRQPQRLLLIEVPAGERIVAEGAFWDVYFEHATYWSQAALTHAFELHGLHVSVCKTAFDGHYTLLTASVAESAHGARAARTQDTSTIGWEHCQQFASRVHTSVENVRHQLQCLDSDGQGVVLWQGASKTVGLLSALGSTQHIRCAVDQHPARHDKHLPGSGLVVRPPQALSALQPQHVVLLNDAYAEEVARALGGYSPRSQLHTINQLMAAA
jgi:hypothetical protein